MPVLPVWGDMICDSVSGFSGAGIAMGIFAFAGMKFCSQMMACLLERYS